MIDGPCGGCSVALAEHEAALLFAGGLDITPTLRLYSRRHNGERHGRILRNRFAWCVRSVGGYFLRDFFTVADQYVA